MRAIRQHEFGPPETLEYAEVEDPVPAEGQVRIAVRVAGVHLIDTSIRAGESPFGPVTLPMTPGREVAGVVDALGAGVEQHWLGKRVVAHLGMASGGYAELAVANAASLHELPDDLEFETAVAMIGTGRTTTAILDAGALEAEDTVLVPAAAGGIGNLVVQSAVRIGAKVVGLAGGEEKVRLVRELGADAIDYRQPDWPEKARAALGERGATIVFDGVGGEVGRAALELLADGGRLVLYGWSSGSRTEFTVDDLLAKGLRVDAGIGRRLIAKPGGMREFESRALAAAAAGEWRPVVQRFALADAAASHAALEARKTTGKVVLIP